MDTLLVIGLGHLGIKRCKPHDQGSHQNAPIIGPIGAFFISTMNNEVILHPLFDLNVFQGSKKGLLKFLMQQGCLCKCCKNCSSNVIHLKFLIPIYSCVK